VTHELERAASPSGDNVQIEYVVREVPAKRRSPLRRAGCALLIVLWFTFLLTPLLLFVLAIEGEITIAHGAGIPDRHEHPRLQIALVMEVDFRGLRITNSTIDRPGDNEMRVQTNVRFLLWQGEGEPASFCDRYRRESPESSWQLESTVMGSCG